MTAADDSESLSGLSLGNHRVCEEIGRGGMAIVYRMEHIETGTELALKVLRADRAHQPWAAARLRREALVYKRVSGPGVPSFFDYGLLPDGRPYLQMQLLRGELLRNRIRDQGLPAHEVLLLGMQLARTLCTVHAASVVHRDLKPENILLIPDQAVVGGLRCIVLDFGIAQIPDSQSDPELAALPADTTPSADRSTVLGTLSYMSKEQLLGKVRLDGRSDVYALGIVLFEMLCGRRPYNGTPEQVRQNILYGAPPHVSSACRTAPPALDSLIHRMMSPERWNRPPMHEVSEQLTALHSRDAALGTPLQILRIHESSLPRSGSALLSTQAGTTGDSTLLPQRWRDALMATALTLLPFLFSPIPRPMQRVDAALPTTALPRTQREIEMVRLAAADVLLGSSEEEIEAAYRQAQSDGCTTCERGMYEREQTASVRVASFELDRHEVTCATVAEVLNRQRDLSIRMEDGRTVLYLGDRPIVGLDNQHKISGFVWRAEQRRVDVISDMADKPAVNVTWYGGELVCRALGKRLPTEAEWEYAARGPQRWPYPWGVGLLPCEEARYGLPTFMKHFCLSNSEGPLAVQRSPNSDKTPQGLYDLGGNVSEWVANVFQERYPRCDGPCPDFAEPEPASLPTDTLRSIRGGSWQQEPTGLRSASRSRAQASYYNGELGFRCAR